MPRSGVQYPSRPAARGSPAASGRRGTAADPCVTTPTQHPSQAGIAARFQRVRRRLRGLRLASGCIGAAGVLAAGLLAADGVDRLHSLREPWALGAAAAAAALALLVLARAWVAAVLRAPSAYDLALEVERVRPELMDSLVCAIQIEGRPGPPPNPIEGALLDQVRDRIDAGAPLAEVFRRGLRWQRLILPAAVFAGCLALALHCRVWRKASACLGDVLRGEATGLVLRAPGPAVPEHSDVRLEVEVRRWEPDAAVEYRDAEGRHRFPMNRVGERRSFFTLYDVTGSLRYRVLTPSLATGWRRLETYRPPRFGGVAIRVEPPPYTGREPQTLDGFRDLQAVAGSRIQVRVETEPGVSAEWHSGGAAEPFAATPEGQAVHEFVLREDGAACVRLRSPEGYETQGPEFRLTAQPDLPPAVTVLQPPRDLQAGRDQTVPMEIRAADDFGVSRVSLTYAISGGPRQSVTLLEAGGERIPDRTLEHALDLAALQVEPGDVITYMAAAVDNRDPDPQETRTEVGFIVIRPPLDGQEKEGSQGPEMKLDISALIAESKRLIRASWDALGLPEPERPRPAADLHRDLHVLSLEIRKTFTRVMNAAGGMVADPLPDLFAAAEREVSEASRIVEQGRIEEGIAPQERGLAALTRIENELLRNAARSQGKGQGDQAQTQRQKPAEEDPSRRRSYQELMEALRDARRRAQELAEKQARLNQSMDSPAAAAPEAARDLADRQSSLAGDTASLARSLEALPEAARARESLDTGAGEMTQCASRLGEADSQAARRHGRRAAGLLDTAIGDLEEALRKAAGDRIRALARTAGDLSEAQRRAAEQSRDLAAAPAPDEAALGQAEKGQRSLNQAFGELRQAVSQTAADLEEPAPDAGQELSQAIVEASRQGLDRSMERAANALLYRKPDRAVKPQTEAANRLLELSSALERAADRLPGLSREELLEALEAMQRQAQAAAEAARQPGEEGRRQLQAAQEAGARVLGPVAAALKDQTLQEVAEQMAAGLGEGSPAEAAAQSLRLFRAAIAILERRLVSADVRRRLDLSRRTARPPEKYRQQVEQYFRDLGREP